MVDNLGPAGSLVKHDYAKGFEVSDGTTWYSVPHTVTGNNTVVLRQVPAGAKRVRYLWYANACGENLFECPLYGRVEKLSTLSGFETFLPVAPFWAEL